MLGILICEDIVLFAGRQNSITLTTSKNEGMLGILICEDIVLFAGRQNSITLTTSKNASEVVTCIDARQMAWTIHWGKRGQTSI